MVGDQERPVVRILGPVELVRPGGVRADLQLQCRKVLALLVTATGRPLSTGQLVRSIWDDDTPSHAPQMVRSHVRVLRGTLRITTTGPAGYRIQPGGCTVDAKQFSRLLADARHRLPLDAPGATRAAGAALDLWRGADAMPDVTDVRQLRGEAAYLEELRCQAEETVVLGSLLSGRAEQTLPKARQLAELYPKRERFWLLLMLAEALSDRIVEATSITFWRARRHLVEETGLRAPGLDRLQRELLNGIPSPELLRSLVTHSSRNIA